MISKLRPPFSAAVGLIFSAVSAGGVATAVANKDYAALTAAARAANETAAPVAPGPFQPTLESLQQFRFPEWFRDAKFGIWAHWGPQCEPEMGDWYARNMYYQYDKTTGLPKDIYNFHVATYGHPTVFGFKDIIPLWKARHWNPAALVAFYKESGAKYFMALANHHDNFDLWDSKYQPWNAVNLGPERDLLAGWAKAAREAGLPFGVSVHAARAWGWNDGSVRADKDGPKAGQTYDGRLTAADGRGKWWDGLDPQDLYAQNHGPKEKPSVAYMRKFYNRTMDLVEKFHPDLLYFDDDISKGLPLYNDDPTVALRIAASLYNVSIRENAGRQQALIAAKKISPDRRKYLLYDIERGGAETILPEPWQTDTCIGHWHYDRRIAETNGYKQAPEVIRMLVDVVSKNGNLMLNVPVRADGTIDDHERKIVADIGAWLRVNGEAIYATRPWAVFGEGGAVELAAITLASGEMAEKKARPLGASDVRFTTSKDGRTLYATVLGWPASGALTIKSLATGSPHVRGKLGAVALLGSPAKITAERTADGLKIKLPAEKPPAGQDAAYVFKIPLLG